MRKIIYFSVLAVAGVATANVYATSLVTQAPPERQARGTNLNEAQRIARHQELGSPVAVTVSFRSKVSEGAAKAVLQRNDAEPFAVWMQAAGLFGMHRVQPAQASSNVIDEARRLSFAQLEAATRENGRAIAAAADRLGKEDAPDSQESFARHLLATRDTNGEMRAVFVGNKPIIYAVGALLPAGSLEKLRQDASVASVAVGTPLTAERLALEEPQLPADSRSGAASRWLGSATTRDNVISELRAAGGR